MTAVATQNASTATETYTSLAHDLSPLGLRSAFSRFPSGVAAVSGYANGQREVLVASSFMVGVSLEPPLVALAVQNTSRTWPRLRQADRLGVSVLGEGHTATGRQLASKDGDRFAGLDLHVSDSGGIFLDAAALWLETSVHSEFPAGDHQMVLLEVHGLADEEHQADPLVFHRSDFRNLRTVEDTA